MTRYLIKVTYLTGEHEGESFLLNKKKQVVMEHDVHTIDTTYKTHCIAYSCSKRLYGKNEDNKYYGRPYTPCSYEPFEITLA